MSLSFLSLLICPASPCAASSLEEELGLLSPDFRACFCFKRFIWELTGQGGHSYAVRHILAIVSWNNILSEEFCIG